MFGLLIRRIDKHPMGVVEFTISNSCITKDIFGHVFYPDKKKSYLVSLNDSKDEGSLIVIP